MKFAPISPHDYPAIARAERARRRQASARAGWDQARRAADDADWGAIEDFDFHLVEIRAPADRANTPCRRTDDRLVDIVATVARTAMRRWLAEGERPGEPEARAFKLLNLARRMARCTGRDPVTFSETERNTA